MSVAAVAEKPVSGASGTRRSTRRSPGGATLGQEVSRDTRRQAAAILEVLAFPEQQWRECCDVLRGVEDRYEAGHSVNNWGIDPFDNAISKEAAKTKGIESEVAGDPDILLVPDLEAGNILAKQLSFLANADSAGLVLGARVPIILTSRSDSVRSRIASCAVASLMAQARRAKP
jgi:hypothetical protein